MHGHRSVLFGFLLHEVRVRLVLQLEVVGPSTARGGGLL